MQPNLLKYQGRVPKRSGSLAKRNQILQASLDIIRDQGLRGVRHRAVAEQAGVPLAATTYYFNDINELIVDSFVYFMEQNIQLQETVFQEVLKDFKDKDLESISDGEKTEYFHQLLFGYLAQQINDKTSRIIERSFAQYASRIPELAVYILQIQFYFEQQIGQMLQILNVENPQFKAHIVLAFINITEERALLSDGFDEAQLNKNIELLVQDTFA